MKKMALLIVLIASPAYAQFKVAAPAAVKPGEHIVIDATNAKGTVGFVYDKNAFPTKRATLTGKVLVLSTDTPGKYTVAVASFDDKTLEEIVVTVGEDAAKPTPKQDEIDALRNEMRAGFSAIAKGFDAVHERLKALEGKTPVPPTPKITLAFLTFVGPDLATVAVVNDAALRARLKAANVKVFVYQANDPGIEARGLDKAVKAAGGVPCMILQDEGGNVIGQVRLTTVAAANQFLDAYLGK